MGRLYYACGAQRRRELRLKEERVVRGFEDRRSSMGKFGSFVAGLDGA